jgi:hypothetical protein
MKHDLKLPVRIARHRALRLAGPGGAGRNVLPAMTVYSPERRQPGARPGPSRCRYRRCGTSRSSTSSPATMAEAQADVTMRGDTFENTGHADRAPSRSSIPQTGHYLTELPIAPAMLGAPSDPDRCRARASDALNSTGGARWTTTGARIREDAFAFSWPWAPTASSARKSTRASPAPGPDAPGGRRRLGPFLRQRHRARRATSTLTAPTARAQWVTPARRRTSSPATRRASSAGPTSTLPSTPTRPRTCRPCSST